MRKRSSCASGSGKVPSWSIGFCVAMTRNGGLSTYVCPSTLTRRSAIASRSAGLRSRRRPVDLVGQQRLGENRAGAELELAGLLVEDRDAGHVGRQQVGRTLEPLEGAADAPGQGSRQHRLGDARHVFEQDVPFGEVRRDRQRQDGPLADDDLLDVGDDAVRDCRPRRWGAWAKPCGVQGLRSRYEFTRLRRSPTPAIPLSS